MGSDNKPDEQLVNSWSWETLMASGFQGLINKMINENPGTFRLHPDHMEKTPERVVKLYKEYFKGLQQNPTQILHQALFDSNFNGLADPIGQMIHIKDIPFFSMCAHHFVVFYGTATFSYIPGDKIVGLSKIPRMIECLASRPQVQEALTEEIVDIFSEAVHPRGCGIVMKAKHMCMCSRGIKSSGYTETTALNGNFLDSSVKAEFIACAINGQGFSV